MEMRGRPTLTVRLDQAEIDALADLAAERGVSRAVFVREHLASLLGRPMAPPRPRGPRPRAEQEVNAA
jgi:Ribbon-helix-helix protein, copG family